MKTGMIAAAGTSFVGFTILFTAIAIETPGLLLAPFSKPFIFVILATLVLIALGYGALVGAIGAIVGRWTAPDAPREARVS
jgi:dipeptide/tripeptide permease